MTVLTDCGLFLTDEPAALVARLESLVAVGTGAERLHAECRRVERYRLHIGPAMADVAAQNLLRGLEQEGLLLIVRP